MVASFDVNKSAFQVKRWVLTYKFKGSNDSHNFTIANSTRPERD